MKKGYNSKYDPKSERAKKGMRFQKRVQESLDRLFQNAICSRDWLLAQDECLSQRQLNMLERTWGDIVLIDSCVNQKIFVECVSLNYENSIFPEHKIKMFSGANKFYCFGWDGEMRFIHSFVWNKYAEKCESYAHYKKFSRDIILKMRNQYVCAQDFQKHVMEMKHV
tara:strand:+ start:1553 stop:2053 length:501 start_codon:yes stop_codon:yes gene_type:complete